MESLPIKPIAVQQITAQSAKMNKFDLYEDIWFVNGYDEFDSYHDLDEKYQKFLVHSLEGSADKFPYKRNCLYVLKCLAMDDYAA